MNLLPHPLPDGVEKWNKPLNRTGETGMFDPQVGFELTGIHTVLREFCDSHQVSGNECTIGVFLYFYENDDFLGYIRDIKVKKLNVHFNTISGQHWLSRMSAGEGTLKLEETNEVQALGWRISHFNGNPAHRDFADAGSVRANRPTLLLEDAAGYGIQTIRGYRGSLRIAYLDYGTLMHLFLAYRIGQPDEIAADTLKFLFTGAEINHGELVNPFFQEERVNSHTTTTPDYDIDTSVTATLKMEGVYHVGNNQYEAAENYVNHVTTQNISLPGVKVLPPCRSYWQVVEQVLNSASGQTDFSNLSDFPARRAGMQNFSDKLTEDNLVDLLGDKIFFNP